MLKLLQTSRSSIFTLARISEIKNATKNVKILKLVPEKPLPYHPGQWIDFDNLQPNSRLLGLSLINHDENCLEIAAKISPHPTVQWIHQKAKLNQNVKIQVGDDLTLTINDEIVEKCENSGIVLIAGGIGINPFLSMLDYFKKNESKCLVTLINISRTEEEDIFKERLKSLQIDNVDIYTFYSEGKREIPEGVVDILKKVKTNENSSPRTYLCGPGGFMVQFSEVLSKIGYETPITEKWASLAFDLHNKQQK